MKKNYFLFFLLIYSLCFSQNTDELFNAIKNGSLSGVKKEITKFPDPNVRTTNGKTPLAYACELGDENIVKYLISYVSSSGQKVDINAIDNEKRTPLIIAAIYGNPKIVQMLINANAYIMHKDNNGKTAINYATEKNNTEVLNILNGALQLFSQRITEQIYNEMDKDNEETVKKLIEDGADLNKSIIYAIQKKYIKYIKYFIMKGANFNDNFFYNKEFKEGGIATSLQFACYIGDKELAEKVVNYDKVDINFLPSRVDIRKPALIFAIESNNKDLVNFLLSKGASLEAKLFFPANKFPLNIAVQNNNFDIVDTLIKFGYDIRQQDADGFTALYYALRYYESNNDNKMFEKLLMYGADINGLEGGITLLMRFVQEANPKIVEYLISKKADINKNIEKNKFYNGYFTNAIQMALGAVNKNKDVIKLLLNAGAKIELDKDFERDLAIWSIEEGDVSFTEMLLKNGVNINYFSVGKKAIENNNVYMLELLIKYGLDVNITNESGRTLLIEAVLVNDTVRSKDEGSGSYDLVELLVKNNAIIETKDLTGKNAIDYCKSKRIRSFLQYHYGKQMDARLQKQKK